MFLLFCLGLGWPLLAFGQFGSPPAETTPKLVSPEEIDRQISQGKHYDFDVSPGGYLVDAKGVVIRNSELREYLRKNGYAKNAYYVLWMGPDSPRPDQLGSTLEALRLSGVTKVAARRKKTPGELPATPVEAPPLPPPTPTAEAKPAPLPPAKPAPTLVRRAGEALPSMIGRPAVLRPGALPAGISYKFASDADVVKAADLIAQQLLATSPKDAEFFAPAVLVQTGAWKRFRHSRVHPPKEAFVLTNLITISGKSYKQESCVLRDADEIAELYEKLREAIEKDGGGTVRALQTEEMSKWGLFGSKEIEEPVLALETKGKKHVFIIGFAPAGAVLLDDLNNLE
ncbi:MAG TPA: hypothetical protein VMC06_06270 [Opitutaceae bacterium]|nr:hypothetical protein [Opitutaceae bacterium]